MWRREIDGDIDLAKITYPKIIEGHELVVDYGKRVSVRVTCKHCGHTRWRGIHMDSVTLGPMAPVLFLETWLSRRNGMAPAAHVAYRPTRQDMIDYMLTKT